MVGKLIIPVMDTENGDYDYKGKLSTEEYAAMVVDEFNKTNNQMNRFVDNMMNGVSNSRSRYRVYDVDGDSKNIEVKYKFCEAEAFIQDSHKNDVEEDVILSHVSDGKMFILVVNINPTNLDGDAESELRFWIDDSIKVHNDRTLDDTVKLKRLPSRDLKIKIKEEEYWLDNCKILQNYSNRKYPFHFAFIVEKITK